MSLVAPLKMFRSRSERRQHSRTSKPAIRVAMGGKKYRTADWSMGGFRISGYHAPLALKEQIEGRISSIAGSGGGGFMVEVVRVQENGDIGLRFLEIEPHIFMALCGLNVSR